MLFSKEKVFTKPDEVFEKLLEIIPMELTALKISDFLHEYEKADFDKDPKYALYVRPNVIPRTQVLLVFSDSGRPFAIHSLILAAKSLACVSFSGGDIPN